MHRPAAAVAFAITLLSSCHSPAPRYTKPARVVDRLIDASVVVRTPAGGMGSGTVVGNTGGGIRVLTCLHVIAGSPFVNVEFGGASHLAEVEKADPTGDLALLYVAGSYSIAPIPLARTEPDVGDRIWVVSSPMEIVQSVADGVIAHKQRSYDGRTVWQINSTVAPGSSGGTVANEQGELVAVPEAVYMRQGAVLTALAMAIPLPQIRDFLAGYV